MILSNIKVIPNGNYDGVKISNFKIENIPKEFGVIENILIFSPLSCGNTMGHIIQD